MSGPPGLPAGIGGVDVDDGVLVEAITGTGERDGFFLVRDVLALGVSTTWGETTAPTGATAFDAL